MSLFLPLLPKPLIGNSMDKFALFLSLPPLIILLDMMGGFLPGRI
jgi:hypothetical protein